MRWPYEYKNKRTIQCKGMQGHWMPCKMERKKNSIFHLFLWSFLQRKLMTLETPEKEVPSLHQILGCWIVSSITHCLLKVPLGWPNPTPHNTLKCGSVVFFLIHWIGICGAWDQPELLSHWESVGTHPLHPQPVFLCKERGFSLPLDILGSSPRTSHTLLTVISSVPREKHLLDLVTRSCTSFCCQVANRTILSR